MIRLGAILVTALLLGSFSAEPRDVSRVRGGQHVVGTAGSDRLLGTFWDDEIDGLDGDDTIRAKGGNDVIRAGRGNDRIFPGGGHNTIRCGAGIDELILADSRWNDGDHWFDCEAVIMA